MFSWLVSQFNVTISSFVGHLGLLYGFIGACIWKSTHPKEDFLDWVELGALGFTFFWMFGEMGCVSVHDHSGVQSDFVLAISGWPDGMTRHDLGFYAAIWWIVIAVIVLILDRKPKPRGFFLAILPLMYAPIRFSLDFLHIGPHQGGVRRYFGLTPVQYFSIVLFCFGIYFLKKTWNRPPIVWKRFTPQQPNP